VLSRSLLLLAAITFLNARNEEIGPSKPDAQEFEHPG
jgi:hypothetical protein